MVTLVKKFVDSYGVPCHWFRYAPALNSRGEKISGGTPTGINQKVLLLKQHYNPIKDREMPIGVSPDFTRYVLTLPDTDIQKDDVLTDSHGLRWKVGPVDWFDIGGTPVCRQAPLLEVNHV
jgi:hypothetical protein